VTARRSAVPLQIILLLAVCAAVFWVRLGEGGLHASEAHRVAPAYEMLDGGGWLVPRMFEQPYLRKPPGMPWAIAGMTELLGRNEFAARSVSALASTGMVLIAFWAGRRWFGAGLAAGLAQALMPVLWESGRAAEIEALNHLGTQIAAFLLLDALVFARTPRARLLGAVGAAGGVVWFALAKGPASAPVLVGVIAAACVATRSLRPLGGVVWVTLGLAGAALGVVAYAIARAVAAEPLEPVLQSPEAFLFEPGRILGVLTLAPAAFAQCLPVSLALLFPWGPDARREAEGWDDPRRFTVARSLAWAWVVAVGVFMLSGVGNPRYTLPAAVLIPPLVGYVLAGMARGLHPRRERIARALLLGHRLAWPTLLVVVSGAYVQFIESGRRATSGRDAGGALGRAIVAWCRAEPGRESAVVLADHVVEARPEVLLAAQAEVRAAGLSGVRFRWVPGLQDLPASGVPSGPVLAVLRDDDGSGEAGRFGALSGVGLTAIEVGEAGGFMFHKYRARLFFVSQPHFSDHIPGG
jgi:4-amino-4-deoxy-L-arabinose transferase-like glycosyltransferase